MKSGALFFSYHAMLALVFLSYFHFFSFSWVLKDVGVFGFLIYTILKIKPVNIKFPTFGFFMQYLYMFMIIISHFIANGIDLTSLISIRFLFVYFMLILIGFNVGKYFTEKKVFSLIYVIYWFIILIGVLEWFYPSIVYAYTVGDNIHALQRTGLGIGLGSIFGSRVAFGFVLTYFLIIAPIFFKSRTKLFILQMSIFSLIVLTLSKTAIFTSSAIIIIDLLIYMKVKEKNSILKKISFILLLLMSLLFILFNSNDIVDTFFLAVTNSDFSTFSGRTDNWNNLQYSLLPNLYYVGTSTNLGVGFDVVVDSAFLRMLINFGLLSILPITIIVIELVRNWKNINIRFKYILLMILLYSVTVDFYHIAIVTVPLWFSIGFYLYQLKSKRNITV